MPLKQMCQHHTLLNTQGAGVKNCVVMTSKTCAHAVFVTPGIVHFLREESGSSHLLFP